MRRLDGRGETGGSERSIVTTWGTRTDCCRSLRRVPRDRSGRLRVGMCDRRVAGVRHLVRSDDVDRHGGCRCAPPARRHRADRTGHGTDLRHARRRPRRRDDRSGGHRRRAEPARGVARRGRRPVRRPLRRTVRPGGGPRHRLQPRVHAFHVRAHPAAVVGSAGTGRPSERGGPGSIFSTSIAPAAPSPTWPPSTPPCCRTSNSATPPAVHRRICTPRRSTGDSCRRGRTPGRRTRRRPSRPPALSMEIRSAALRGRVARPGRPCPLRPRRDEGRVGLTDPCAQVVWSISTASSRRRRGTCSRSCPGPRPRRAARRRRRPPRRCSGA